MKELKKESAISTFDQAEILLSQGETLQEGLNALAEFIQSKNNCHISFCQIFGKRWSFEAGDKQMASFDQKIIISNKWGILVQGFLSKDWENLLKRLFQDL